MDVDKKYPTIDFRYSGNKTCEVALELNQARGAVWVGDVVCQRPLIVGGGDADRRRE
ncbi:putative fimbrial outer membrane usher protein [Escherichia coli]|uniref:Putative fimbrial outer membrane usher protein n=1 Tax=Escherichia coli TaxID=562 RepID=A0A376RNR0_ECOLX|nr:putative fimbrial outer membrane usher protein [Escherichia coli]